MLFSCAVSGYFFRAGVACAVEQILVAFAEVPLLAIHAFPRHRLQWPLAWREFLHCSPRPLSALLAFIPTTRLIIDPRRRMLSPRGRSLAMAAFDRGYGFPLSTVASSAILMPAMRAALVLGADAVIHIFLL